MAANLDDVSRQLLQLSGLIQTSVANYVSLKNSVSEKNEGSLPSKPLFDAQRALLAAAGMLTELVSVPENRLLEVSSQYFEARALHIVADKRVPDILASNKEGVDIQTLASAVNIEPRKLCKLPGTYESFKFPNSDTGKCCSSRYALSLLHPRL